MPAELPVSREEVELARKVAEPDGRPWWKRLLNAAGIFTRRDVNARVGEAVAGVAFMGRGAMQRQCVELAMAYAEDIRLGRRIVRNPETAARYLADLMAGKIRVGPNTADAAGQKGGATDA